MGIALATEFKRVYAEWAYRKASGEDASLYAESVLVLWDGMDPFTRDAVKSEILSTPQVVGTQFLVGPTRVWPMFMHVVKWALPGVDDVHAERKAPKHSGYPAWRDDTFEPSWVLPDAG